LKWVDTNQIFSYMWTTFEAGQMLTTCAWCRRVWVDSAWVVPPRAALAAIDERNAFSHSICGECALAYVPPMAAATCWTSS